MFLDLTQKKNMFLDGGFLVDRMQESTITNGLIIEFLELHLFKRHKGRNNLWPGERDKGN